MPRPRLELFFDYSSPFAYLATTAAPGIADAHGAELVFRPFLLGALFREIGTPLVPIAETSDAKRRYTHLDLQRWAEVRGVPLSFPTRFPLRTVTALRMTLLAGPELRRPLVRALMRACWADDLDPVGDDTLLGCAREAGVGAELLAASRAEPAKTALRESTDEAVRRGVPGAPTFFVDGDLMFWGQDRLDFVERALDGWRPSKG